MTSVNDAREWRAASARLLASYPAHPGLLAGRGLAEIIDLDGNLLEFEFNLLQSLEESVKSYGTSNQDLIQFGQWLLATIQKRNPSVVGSVCAILDFSGVHFDELDECIRLSATSDDTILSVLSMSKKIDLALITANETLKNIS